MSGALICFLILRKRFNLRFPKFMCNIDIEMIHDYFSICKILDDKIGILDIL